MKICFKKTQTMKKVQIIYEKLVYVLIFNNKHIKFTTIKCQMITFMRKQKSQDSNLLLVWPEPLITYEFTQNIQSFNLNLTLFYFDFEVIMGESLLFEKQC